MWCGSARTAASSPVASGMARCGCGTRATWHRRVAALAASEPGRQVGQREIRSPRWPSFSEEGLTMTSAAPEHLPHRRAFGYSLAFLGCLAVGAIVGLVWHGPIPQVQ